jgi:glycosyltransferase involved in cell wall biosynthesis
MAQGVDSTLLIVGDGPDRDRFRQAVADRRIPRVVIRDFVQQRDLPRILASSDALVFPTRGDPYGLVVDEAMAAGLPVISSTSAGEIRTRVIPGETGLLVEPDDSGALHAAMRGLHEHPDRAAAMGDRGGAAMEHRTPERWARQVTDAVRDIVR